MQHMEYKGGHRKGCYQFSLFPPESSNLHLSDSFLQPINTTTRLSSLNSQSFAHTLSCLLFKHKQSEEACPFISTSFSVIRSAHYYLCSFRSLCIGMEWLPLLYLSSFNPTQLPHLQEAI